MYIMAAGCRNKVLARVWILGNLEPDNGNDTGMSHILLLSQVENSRAADKSVMQRCST